MRCSRCRTSATTPSMSKTATVTVMTLTPTSPVGDALALLPKRAHGAIIVIDDGRPVGVVTEADCLGADRFTQLHRVMSTPVVTVPDSVDPRKAFEMLDAEHRRL